MPLNHPILYAYPSFIDAPSLTTAPTIFTNQATPTQITITLPEHATDATITVKNSANQDVPISNKTINGSTITFTIDPLAGQTYTVTATATADGYTDSPVASTVLNTVTVTPPVTTDPAITYLIVNGEAMTAPDAPTIPDGKAFVAWTAQGSDTPFDFAQPITKPVTLVAKLRNTTFELPRTGEGQAMFLAVTGSLTILAAASALKLMQMRKKA